MGAAYGCRGLAFPADRPVNQAIRPLPQYTNIDRRTDADNSGHSTYHAFSAGVEHRYNLGLWLQASYTFSKLISNAQSDHGEEECSTEMAMWSPRTVMIKSR